MPDASELHSQKERDELASRMFDTGATGVEINGAQATQTTHSLRLPSTCLEHATSIANDALTLPDGVRSFNRAFEVKPVALITKAPDRQSNSSSLLNRVSQVVDTRAKYLVEPINPEHIQQLASSNKSTVSDSSK